MSLLFIISLLLLITIIIINGQLDCDDLSVSCVSVFNVTNGSRSVDCSDFAGYILTSCGIRVDNRDKFLSAGTSMSDNVCNIHYKFKNGTKLSNISITELPIPYARCCNFAECYSQNFECDLIIDNSQPLSATNNICTNNHPNLLSCSVQQRSQFDLTVNNNNPIFNGILFGDSGGSFTIDEDYFALFNLTTLSPTLSPTKVPTSPPTSPTSRGATPSPITPTTNEPSLNPTTPAPTTPAPTTPKGEAFSYLSSATNNRCTFQRFDDSVTGVANTANLALFTLCCNEEEIATPAPIPTRAPTPSPTNFPTLPSEPPSPFVFGDGQVLNFLTDPLPNGSIIDENREFTDIADGLVKFIHWGVNNINRTYDRNPDDGSINNITDIPLNETFFTIKIYESLGGDFISEYGRIFLEDDDNGTVCKDIDLRDKANNIGIVKIHVYGDYTKGTKNPKLLGMTMFDDDTPPNNYTCHIAMKDKNDTSQSFMDELYFNDTKILNRTINTADYTDCTNSGAQLSGFQGSAQPINEGFGIQSIRFQFSSDGIGLQDCPNTPTPEPTPGPEPTISPSPSPTNAPTPGPTTTIPPTAIDQFTTNTRTLLCYHIMDKHIASCLNETSSITSSDGTSTTTFTNPSFMTGCAAYSDINQPFEWYIDNNSCIVDSSQTFKIAAIATCCTLIDFIQEEEEPTPAYIIVLIVLGSLVVVAIWVVAIVFCVRQARLRREQEEKANRPDRIIDTPDGERALILDEEQIEDRLDLQPFRVTDDTHNEMLEVQKRPSTTNIGLIP